MLQDDPALRMAALGGGAVILFYLRGVAAGRPRSAPRHHHSAVRAAGGHVGRRGALRRGDEVRRPRVRRGDRRSRRQRPSQADRPWRRSGAAAHQGRPAHRRGGAGGRRPRCSPEGRRWTSTTSNHAIDRRRPLQRFTASCSGRTAARCSATISGGRGSASSPACWSISAIVLAYADSYGSSTRRHPRRHVHPAHPDHDRRRPDARRRASRRPAAGTSRIVIGADRGGGLGRHRRGDPRLQHRRRHRRSCRRSCRHVLAGLAVARLLAGCRRRARKAAR